MFKNMFKWWKDDPESRETLPQTVEGERLNGIDSGTQGARCDTSKNVNEETVAVDGLNATKAGDAGTAGKTSNLTNDASKGKLLKVPEGILKRKSGEIPYLLKSGKKPVCDAGIEELPAEIIEQSSKAIEPKENLGTLVPSNTENDSSRPFVYKDTIGNWSLSLELPEDSIITDFRQRIIGSPVRFTPQVKLGLEILDILEGIEDSVPQVVSRKRPRDEENAPLASSDHSDGTEHEIESTSTGKTENLESNEASEEDPSFSHDAERRKKQRY